MDRRQLWTTGLAALVCSTCGKQLATAQAPLKGCRMATGLAGTLGTGRAHQQLLNSQLLVSVVPDLG